MLIDPPQLYSASSDMRKIPRISHTFILIVYSIERTDSRRVDLQIHLYENDLEEGKNRYEIEERRKECLNERGNWWNE